MSAIARESMMSDMPTTVPARLVLVAPLRGAGGRDRAAVRRFRLARLRVEGTRRSGAPTHARLKHVDD
jgi:hypothetical protein